MTLHATDAAPGVTPQAVDHTLPLNICNKPSPDMLGAPDPPLSSRRTMPSRTRAPVVPQYATESRVWPRHVASGVDHVHSSRLNSSPVHFRSFITTGLAAAPQMFAPPYDSQEDGATLPKSKPDCRHTTSAAAKFIPHTVPNDGPALVDTWSRPTWDEAPSPLIKRTLTPLLLCRNPAASPVARYMY